MKADNEKCHITTLVIPNFEAANVTDKGNYQRFVKILPSGISLTDPQILLRVSENPSLTLGSY